MYGTVKVLMSMPEEEAVVILRRIGTEREKWEFKPYVAGVRNSAGGDVN